MVPRKVRIQADARRVLAIPSSRATVGRCAGKRDRPVRPHHADGQDRTALQRTARQTAAFNQTSTPILTGCVRGRRAKAT